MRIEGSKTFSARALKEGLRNAPGFFAQSHPLAPREEWLRAVERELRLGYQHHGFADASVTARIDTKAEQLVVRVEEGPRYRCGAVRVAGLRQAPADRILKWLTDTNSLAEPATRALVFMDNAPASTNTWGGETSAGNLVVLWLPELAAPLSELDLQRLAVQARRGLRAEGFPFPKVEVKARPDRASGLAALEVNVLQEGPRARIDHIEFAGNKKNTRAALLRFLQVKPGMALTSQLVASLENKLWRAARFLAYNVRLSGPDDAGRVALQISLEEYDQAPPIDREFSRAESASLKLREWGSKLDQNQEELVLTVSGYPQSTSACEIILSPRNGFALLSKHPSPGAGQRSLGGLVLKPGQAAFYPLNSDRKLVVPCPQIHFLAYLAIQPKPLPTADAPFNLSMGARFAVNEDTGNAPYRLELSLWPVACLGFAHQADATYWFDGDLLVRSNQAGQVKLEAATGRPVQYRSHDANNGRKVEAHFEPGALARAVQTVEEQGIRLPNAYDTNAPVSSFVAYFAQQLLTSELLQTYLSTNAGASLTTWRRLKPILLQAKLADLLSPLDQLARSPEPAAADEPGFVVPEFLALTPNQQSIAAAAADSNQTGPLGCWCMATVLQRFQPPLARKLAARGLERLATTDFQRDCRVLLAGDSLLSQCARRLAAALQDLDDASLQRLADELTPAGNELIHDCVRRLRAAKDLPLLDALAPALDVYWDKELKARLTAALQNLAVDPNQVATLGLELYRNEQYEPAAKLFQEAAAQGHPAAQFMLGLQYETGKGLPRDPAAALAWYGRSAAAGYAPAAMTLGNLYSDGISVKQDLLESFVWYSVAAARGDKIAEALRKGLQRKLTPEQLAEGVKRAAQIAGH